MHVTSPGRYRCRQAPPPPGSSASKSSPLPHVPRRNCSRQVAAQPEPRHGAATRPTSAHQPLKPLRRLSLPVTASSSSSHRANPISRRPRRPEVPKHCSPDLVMHESIASTPCHHLMHAYFTDQRPWTRSAAAVPSTTAPCAALPATVYQFYKWCIN